MSFSSKKYLIFVFGFFLSSGVGAQIYFPEDLLVDSLSSDIKKLKVKKIEQYSIWSRDSTQCTLNYVLIYDSTFHLKTLFYNGQRRGDEYFYLDSDIIDDVFGNSTLISDSLNIYAFHFRNQNINLKFYRLDYIFDGDKFIKVEEIEPKYYSGPINVAESVPSDSESISSKRYFENNKLIKIEFFKNDILKYTKLFEYSKLVENSKIELLTKVIEKPGNSNIFIKYYF